LTSDIAPSILDDMRAGTQPSARVVLATALVALLLGAACITGSRRGHALYPPGRVMARHEVATLMGYVKEIDGRDESRHGTSFELLPGCHVIGTPTRWGKTDSQTGGAIIDTGKQVFALPMKAGKTYLVEVGADGFVTGPTFSAFLRARELDGEGNTTREFEPARSQEDLAECLRQAPR
jgi:hypothetical protein